MSKIEKLSLNKTIDYSGETISYLIKEDDTNSNLQSYEEIVHKIHNAKKQFNYHLLKIFQMK